MHFLIATCIAPTISVKKDTYDMWSVTIFFASFICRCFSTSTEQRLDSLEYRLDKKLNKTETDIIELKELVERLNTSEYKTCKYTEQESANQTELEGNTKDSVPEPKNKCEIMDKKIQHIMDHVEKNSEGIMGEFQTSLTVMRKRHEYIQAKVNTNKITIGQVKTILALNDKNNEDISEKLNGNDLRIGKLENKLSVLDDAVSDLGKDLLKFDHTFWLLEDRLIKLDKKSYEINENTERNYLTVANIDHQLVEMDERYHDFVNDMNKFKADIKKEMEDFKNKFQLESLSQKVTTQTCPISWIKNGNTCYLYDKETGEDWVSAVNMCRSLGAKLAEPDTREEMEFLRGFVHGWIGASDMDTEGVFKWESSKNRAEHLPWWPRTPDNYGGNQDCVIIWGSMINDEDCSKRYRYVCEKRL